MTIKKFGLRVVKIISIFLGVLVLLAFLINIWFRFYAEKTLEKLVSMESKGKLSLELKNVSFTYSQNELNLDEIKIFSVDDSNSIASYQFKVKNLNIRTKSLWDFARYKKLEIDNISISEPETIITLLKKQEAVKKDVSLPEQIGHIYDGIRKGLSLLRVRRFESNEGSFSLLNNIIPNTKPITVTHIQLIVDNLKIDSAGRDNTDKFLNSDSVIVRILNQQITLPDGQHSLGFSRFRFNSGLKLIEMDSCSFNRLPGNNNSTYFNLFFDTLKLANLDMLKLYQENKLQADSAYCTNPSFTGFLATAAKNDSNNIPTKKISVKQLSEYRDLLFDVKYVGILNAHLDLSKQFNDKQTNFKSAKNDFVIYGFRSSDSATGKINIDSIKLKLMQNVLYTTDSTYAIRFKDIIIRNDKLILDSLQISNDKYSRTAIKRHHTMDRFVLSGVDWSELLFFNRVKAEKATLYHPIVNRKNVLNIDSKAPSNLFNLLNQYSEKFSLNELEIVNGNLLFQFSSSKSINLENSNLLLSVNKSLNASNYSTIVKSIRSLDFKNGNLLVDDMVLKMKKVAFKGASGLLSLKELELNDNPTHNKALINQLEIDQPVFNESTQSVSVAGIRWEKAAINWSISNTSSNKENKKPVDIEVRSIDGNNTSINIAKEEKTISTFLNNIHVDKASKTGDSKPVVEGLSLSGRNMRFSDSAMKAAVLNYTVSNSKNLQLTDIQFEKNSETDSVSVKLPSLIVSADLNTMIAGNIAVQSVTVNDPVVRIKKTSVVKETAASPSKDFPALSLNQLHVKNMQLLMTQPSENNIEGSFSLHLSDILSSKEKGGSIALLKWESDSLLLQQSNGKPFISAKGTKAVIENILFNKQDTKMEWKALVKNISTKEILATKNMNSDSLLEIKISQFSLSDFDLKDKSLKDLPQLIADNPDSRISSGHISARNKMMTGELYNIRYTAANQQLQIDSTAIIPSQTREEFAEAHAFQSTYLNIRTGTILIDKPDLKRFLKDSTLFIKSVSIQKPLIYGYRDKNKPFEHGIIKSLPVNMLKAVKTRFKVDTVQVSDGVLYYTERSDKTKDTGTLFLTKIESTIFPVSNILNGPNDTLRLKTSSYLMGVAKSTLRFRESYSDSLAGFYLSLRMAPTDLTILNPALIPLLSVKLTTGNLDTISLRAVGREYLSLGEMKMFYNKLHVEFLKNGVEKKTMLTSLMTFAANSLVVRTNNTNRKGVVFFPRDRERAVFHYWVKMALSGLASSVGAKHNKKSMKQYRRELRTRKLPPIEWDNY